MRSPQLVILETDGWLGKQLRELASESRWLIHSARSIETVRTLAHRQPTVLLVQFEPGEDKPAPLQLVADAHSTAPDTPIVAVADVKLPDGERAAWTAALLDLGARYVLFPPLTKPILEDLVSGLMAATIRRVVGEAPPRPAKESASDDAVLDLADEGAEA